MSRNKQKPGKPGRAPRSVQHLTGGPGPLIEAMGRKWRLGFNTQNAKASLEELIRSHVIQKELPTKRALGPELGEMYWRSEVKPLLDEGYYSTFGPGWLSTLKSPDGVVLFLQSLLVKNHTDVDADTVREMLATEPEQVMAAVEVVAPDFFAAVAIQMGYSTEAAKEAAPTIADALREQIAAYRAATEPAMEPETPELATSPT